ncbi:uncharacterized protein LOC113373893 [Ctenocephalides felis]|uniref:uncharacterized protein LOC113373893 n=1 Tax=Ctenocephalides felis TaxID=7515 RepID=UPI000E6E3CD7|nr:uncharacterized protein LOC113373893 [Ctenocephalides felis]
MAFDFKDSLCSADFQNEDMCASLMYLDSSYHANLSSRISTIIAVCTGVVVVFAILGLLVIAKCRQNMAFKKMNLYKNQSMMPADQCVYTKNNNTNVSNYYEDIHEAQHIMYHNMTAIPTYHRPIIKPVAIHYYPNSLHRVDRRQPAYICRSVARKPQNHYEDEPQYQLTRQPQFPENIQPANDTPRYQDAANQEEFEDNPGPIYEELDDNNKVNYEDSESGQRESEDDFAEDELSSVEYKYPVSYYMSETLPLNRSIASHQYHHRQPESHVRNSNPNCCHVNAFQRYPSSQNNFGNSSRYFNNPRIQGQKKVQPEEITSDLECARSDDSENCEINTQSDKKLMKNTHSSAISVHSVKSAPRGSNFSDELKTSRCHIINEDNSDIKVGWKRGILLPDTSLRFHQSGMQSLPYAISRAESARRSNLNVSHTYFNRPRCENGQDSSFGSDSGYSNHTQSSYTRNIK